jgi:hypothetical protein
MPFNALLLPLLGGFLFISLWNRTKYSASRSDGQRLLLESALWGIALLFSSYFSSRFILFAWPGSLAFWRALVSMSGLGTPVGSLILGIFLPLFLNIFWKEEQENARSYRAFSDYLGLLFFQGQDYANPVMVTLRNGKVYIGIVQGCNTPGMHDRGGSIYIQPVISGYRESDTHKLILTTDYTAALEAIVDQYDAQEGDSSHPRQGGINEDAGNVVMSPSQCTSSDLLDRMRIAISMSDVVSATMFSEKLYLGFGSLEKTSD